MGDVAWVDGWCGPLAEARISVQDRGLVFGDGVKIHKPFDKKLVAHIPVRHGMAEHFTDLAAVNDNHGAGVTVPAEIAAHDERVQ